MATLTQNTVKLQVTNNMASITTIPARKSLKTEQTTWCSLNEHV